MDDWGLAKLTDLHRRDLLEILDDRYNLRATLITSQLPVTSWHEAVGDPTLADAILDRVVHNAYKINLSGNSMRKQKGKLTTENPDTEPHLQTCVASLRLTRLHAWIGWLHVCGIAGYVTWNRHGITSRTTTHEQPPGRMSFSAMRRPGWPSIPC